MWQRMLADFEAKHPAIDVKMEFLPGARYAEVIQRQLVAGNAPDVILFPDEPYPKYVAAGAFEDLTPYLLGHYGVATPAELKTQLHGEYWPTSIDSFGRGEESEAGEPQWRQYGMPVWGGCNLYYYNRENFQRAKVRVTTLSDVGEIEWVGLRNYVGELDAQGDVVHIGAAVDPDVGRALYNTFYYTFIAVPLGLTVSLLLAVLLNQKLRGITFFRTVFYMPHVIGGVATIMMWMWVFHPDAGLLNAVIRFAAQPLEAVAALPADWEAPGWIYSATWSKPALILMAVWGAGGAMLIFLAALQNVPEQLYEAARIDGAGEWQIFWRIFLPNAKPALATVAVMAFIAHWKEFMQPLIYLSDFQMYPISVGLLMYNTLEGAWINYLMAASVVALAPLVVIFFFAQRYFVKGLLLTGTKG